jgi:acid phosphatase type 7
MNAAIHIAICVSLLCPMPAWAQGQPSSPPPIGILLAAGDIAKCNPKSGRDEATALVLRSAIEEANQRQISVRILALGDLAYDNGTDQQFRCFDRSWGSFKSAMLPVPGNHDYANTPDLDAAPYFRYFESNALVSANGKKTGYYSVNFPDAQTGPWRLIGIGLNAYVRTGGGRAQQLKWLREDLKSNSEPCILAFLHPFVLSSGYHGHLDDKSARPQILNSMLPAFTALYQYGATLVLAGHDHDFEQFARHDPTGARAKDGIRSFVIGTGGGGLYKSKQTTRWDSSEIYQEGSYGVLKIQLYPDSYEWSFLPIAGGKGVELPIQADHCNPRHL